MNRTQNLLIAIVILTLGACSAAHQGDTSTLEAKAFKLKMEEVIGFNLVDVRTPEEFALNHIDGAQNINVNAANFEQLALTLDKTKPVMIYCKSGNRSATAASFMKEKGYTIYELAGGIMSWQNAGLPLVMAQSKEENDSYTLDRYKKETTENQLVLVDFHATWCGPCKMMAPHIEVVKETYKDKLTVIKVDTDKSMEVAEHFKINGIPLVKLYKNGKEVYDRTGYHSQEELQALLIKHL